MTNSFPGKNPNSETSPEPTTAVEGGGAGAMVEAIMVRIYLGESDRGLKPLLKCLHDELNVCGATVTRGVAGFGASGVVHSASLIDLSTDLPLVLEFFDRPERAQAAIERIKTFVEPGHVVSWRVQVDSDHLDQRKP